MAPCEYIQRHRPDRLDGKEEGRNVVMWRGEELRDGCVGRTLLARELRLKQIENYQHHAIQPSPDRSIQRYQNPTLGRDEKSHGGGGAW